MTIKTLLIAALFAAASSAPDLAQDKKDLCKLAGKLANAVTNEPVRKAKVSLHPDDPSKTVYTVASDAEGKFRFENIDPGRYTLEGEKEGFVEGWYGATNPDGSGTTIDLKAGKDTSELAFKLTPQGIIAGRVLDDEGEPVSGVMVMPMRYMYESGHKQLTPVMSGVPIQTNDLGEFRLSGLAPGSYYVHSAAQKFPNFEMGGEKAQGNAPQESLVPVYFPNTPDAASASAVPVGPGAEVRGIDIRLKKVRTQTVSGKVVDAAGNPQKSGILMLYENDPGTMSILPVGTFMVQGVKGEFEMRGIAPGSYNLMAMLNNDPTHMTVAGKFEVTDQPLRDLTIRAGAGVDLPVTVKMTGGDPSTIRLMLEVDGNPLASMNNVEIGKDGKGVLKHVGPDNYKIMVNGIPPDHYLQSAQMGSRDVLDSGLDLRSGAGGTLELTVATPAAQLTGTVLNDKNELVPGATVTVGAKDAKFRTDMVHTATTDQAGHFQIAGMVPGEYRVYAWQEIEAGAAEDEEFRKPFEKFRADVDLTHGNASEPVKLTMITKAQVVDAQARR